jgi:CHAT domain-containing protein
LHGEKFGIKVHPVYAQELAISFYKEWLQGGVTKAQALRQAQLQMRARGVETVHWSHHILIGDYR